MNVGKMDKVIRGIIGVGAASFAYFGAESGGTLGIILYVIAGIMIVTAAVGFCPIYKIIGTNTCKLDLETK